MKGVDAARAVIWWVAQGCIGSSSGFVGVHAFLETLRAFQVPLARGVFIGMAGATLQIRELLCDPAHQFGQLDVGLVRLFLECCGRPQALSGQHGAKPQPVEQRLGHHANGSAAEILAFLILRSGLRHLHESGFLEHGYSAFTAALAHSGFPHDGAHVDVDKAAGERRGAQTHGSQIKMSQDRFQDNLAGLSPFRPGFLFGWDSRGGHFFG